MFALGTAARYTIIICIDNDFAMNEQLISVPQDLARAATALRGRKRRDSPSEDAEHLPTLADTAVVEVPGPKEVAQPKAREIPPALVEIAKQIPDEAVTAVFNQLDGVKWKGPTDLIRAVLAAHEQYQKTGAADQDIPVVRADEAEIPEQLNLLGKELSEENLGEMRRYYALVNKLIEKPFETSNLQKQFNNTEGGRQAAQFLIRTYILDYAKRLLAEETDEVKRKNGLENFVRQIGRWTQHKRNMNTTAWERGSLHSFRELDAANRERSYNDRRPWNERTHRREDDDQLEGEDVLAAKWLRDVLADELDTQGKSDKTFPIIQSEVIVKAMHESKTTLQGFVERFQANRELLGQLEKRITEETRQRIGQRLGILSFVRGYMHSRPLDDWAKRSLENLDQTLERYKFLLGPDGSYQDTTRGKEVKTLNVKSQEMFAMGAQWEKPFIAREHREKERQQAMEQQQQQERDRQQAEQLRQQLEIQRQQELGVLQQKFLDAARAYKQAADEYGSFEQSLQQQANGGIFQQIGLLWNRSKNEQARATLKAQRDERWNEVLAVRKEAMRFMRADHSEGASVGKQEELIDSFNLLISSVTERHRLEGAGNTQLGQMTLKEVERRKAEELREAIQFMLPNE